MRMMDIYSIGNIIRGVFKKTWTAIREASRHIMRLLIYGFLVCVLCILVARASLLGKSSKHLVPNVPSFQQHSRETHPPLFTRPPLVTKVPKPLFSSWRRSRRVLEVNCRKIFDGDKKESQKAQVTMARKRRKPFPDETYVELTRNCTDFVHKRGYLLSPLSEEEANFPIAYSILLYKEAEQAERLLRSIYQPQNVYCLHVDRDSPQILHEAMRGIASCLPNVFIASKLESIVYEGFSRLQADINCMTDLSLTNVSWRYFLNQPSQAFPLRTNAEIVKILKLYNGSNDIEGVNLSLHTRLKKRLTFRHTLKYTVGSIKPSLIYTRRKKEKPPYNLTLTKGSAYGVFSRDFVQFILHNHVAQALLSWSKDTFSPDEYYWSTLHHTKANPTLETPGGYRGEVKKPWLSAYSAWEGDGPCHGQFRHWICVFGVEDLQLLEKRKQFFANKFYLTYQHLALDCLEELIYNRTINKEQFNTSFYEQLPFVKH